MSNHKTALVPIETWCFNSPNLRYIGKNIDIGLFAESLIYYDQILLNVANPSQFAELIQWLIEDNSYQEFLGLIKDGVVKLYDFAFLTTVVNKNGVFSEWNIQDPIQVQPNTFEQRYLYSKEVEACFKKTRHKIQLYKAIRGNVIEVKADAFGTAIKNARIDNGNASRHELFLQAFIDELYNFRKLGKPPVIKATIIPSTDGTKYHIVWNIHFAPITKLAGKNLNFHEGVPLMGGVRSNRLLLAAAKLNCDMFLGQPMSILVGDKLYESTYTSIKHGKTIETLKEKVDFPDIRHLVNEGQISLNEIIKIRGKARRFRDWLQTESDRDQDAIIAYHHEVAKESGFIKCSRKAINLFGILGGGAIGSIIGGSVSGVGGATIGGMVGSGTGFLADIASKIGADWKPVVFGNWTSDRIEKVLRQKNKKG
ncbi:hypothetical protein KAS42_01605 [bacterium]|nr:hypothetical protein [bacterium]